MKKKKTEEILQLTNEIAKITFAVRGWKYRGPNEISVRILNLVNPKGEAKQPVLGMHR